MNRKTTVITGGSSGLGLVTARHLIAAGHDIILVGRDAARTRAAANSLCAMAPAGSNLAAPKTYVADLEQWSQVRNLAAKLAADAIRVDVLINNAGAAFPKYQQTPDGAERTYAINHHAPFLLVHALLASGVFATNARIINLSTFVEKRGQLDVHDPDVAGTSWKRRFYNQINVYATSKLVSLLAARELARRLPDGMHIYSANPGMVKDTAFSTHAGGLMRLTNPLFRPFALTPDEGVQTPVWLATTAVAPQPNGGFFSKSKADTPSRLARNDDPARIVYDKTAALLGIEATRK